LERDHTNKISNIHQVSIPYPNKTISANGPNPQKKVKKEDFIKGLHNLNKASSENKLRIRGEKRPGSSSVVICSQPFSKIKKADRMSGHVGYSFSKRDMIYVENNSINMRPLTSLKKPQVMSSVSPTSSKTTFVIDNNLLYNKEAKSLRIIGPPSANNRIGMLLNNPVFSNSTDIDKLKKYINENENKPDYYNYLDKSTVDDKEMLKFHKSKKKEMDNLLTEINNRRELKLSSSKSKGLSINKEVQEKQKLDTLSKNTELGDNLLVKSNTLQNFFNENIACFNKVPDSNHQSNSRDDQTAEQNWKTRVSIDKFSNEDKQDKSSVGKTLTRNISSSNKYMRSLSQSRNLLSNSPRSTKTVLISSPYISSEKLRVQEMEQNKKKWLSPKGFMVFNKRNNVEGFIHNYVTMTPSIPANKHVFREEDRSKWKGNNFKKY